MTKEEIEERLQKCNKILQETHAMIDILLEQKNAYSEDREEVNKIDTDLDAVSEAIDLTKVVVEPKELTEEPIK